MWSIQSSNSLKLIRLLERKNIFKKSRIYNSYGSVLKTSRYYFTVDNTKYVLYFTYKIFSGFYPWDTELLQWEATLSRIYVNKSRKDISILGNRTFHKLVDLISRVDS